jgi:hypothetical protein
MPEICYVLTLEKKIKMNKKLVTVLSVLVIVVFIGYIIFDSVRPQDSLNDSTNAVSDEIIADAWRIERELKVSDGSLKAVAAGKDGSVYLGGDSFVNCYDKDLKIVWTVKTPYPVTSLAVRGDSLIASSVEQLMIMSLSGKIEDEWGPFEEGSIINSVAVNDKYVAFSDAGNKMVFILDRKGTVASMIGQNGDQFVLPSPYFDLALDNDNSLFIANTGHRRVETRDLQGKVLSQFGEPGIAPQAFCGCCNPAHFILIPDGIVTAEKGINRIKILSRSGEFKEFVSSDNSFFASVPLDLASPDGVTIYAANPADSKLYVFKRK